MEDQSKDVNMKKRNFLSLFKIYYKEVIVIFIGVMIGGTIGSIGKVPKNLSNEVTSQIESNTKSIEKKENELKELNSKKDELKAFLNSN